MIEPQVLNQVKGVLAKLSTTFTFVVERNLDDEKTKSYCNFVEDVASCSKLITVQYREGRNFKLSIARNGKDTGISFSGIPNGHEFTSLLLALLNGDGQGRNLPDAALTRRIKALQGDMQLKTYVSLTCTNCPDVVQALNVMALLNPAISNETVDGALHQDEIEKLNIQAVPSVYINGDLLHVGRGTWVNCWRKSKSTWELPLKLPTLPTSTPPTLLCSVQDRQVWPQPSMQLARGKMWPSWLNA